MEIQKGGTKIYKLLPRPEWVSVPFLPNTRTCSPGALEVRKEQKSPSPWGNNCGDLGWGQGQGQGRKNGGYQPPWKIRLCGDLKRNMVPGRGEVLSLEHLLWVGLLDCLLVRRILEHVEAGRLVG